MWYFGPLDYYNGLIEFNSWSLTTGFPQSNIYSVSDAKDLILALARRDEVGVAFRRNLIYKATTFIGDGSVYINEVGNAGEVAYSTEANNANFSCTGVYKGVCDLLSVPFTSSAEHCKEVGDLLFFEELLLLLFAVLFLYWSLSLL
jgi:hypothetical protein